MVTSKDAALRALGRTVANFQRLEHNLKLAARLGPIQGTLSKVQRDMEKRGQRAATLTLGQAIQDWLSACDGELLPTSYTPDLFDVTMRMTFSLEADAASRSAHAAALKALLETRNELVHGGLVRFQWDSPDECDRLVMQLDELNRSITTQIEYVHSILTAFRSICLESIETMQAETADEVPRGEQPER